MPPLRRIFPALSLSALFIACILSVSPASAASPAPLLSTDESPAVAEATTATCTIESGPISQFSYVWGSSSEVWTDLIWKIHPDACAACPFPQALALQAVAFRVRWSNGCSAVARVTIIGARLEGGCVAPDTTKL